MSKAALVVIVGVLDLVEGICGFTWSSKERALVDIHLGAGGIIETAGQAMEERLCDEADRTKAMRNRLGMKMEMAAESC